MAIQRQLAVGLFSIAWILVSCHGKVHYKVRCSEDWMAVEIVKTEDVSRIYLDQLKHYPDPVCHPEIEESKATFKLSLKDVFQCGVTRVSNQLTGRRTYYHRIIVETTREERPKEVILAKCIMGLPVHRQNHTIHRRNVLPAGFQEPEDLEITTSLTEMAPEPMLKVGVRQGGQLVTGELNVNPGTPLQMEIYLDTESAPVYGLLVSYMQVTDTKAQEETIIFNGCSIDPYLFENFNTVDGDFLSAKFRAFKFPESTYVQFKGTVNVCLDKCRGVECSNGQVGYGRRKREVNELPPDPNKVFEVTMTTFIKVDYKGDKLYEKATLAGILKPDKNESLSNSQQDHLKLDTEEIREEFKYTLIEERNAASSVCNSIMYLAASILLLVLRQNF